MYKSLSSSIYHNLKFSTKAELHDPIRKSIYGCSIQSYRGSGNLELCTILSTYLQKNDSLKRPIEIHVNEYPLPYHSENSSYFYLKGNDLIIDLSYKKLLYFTLYEVSF
jgi:hypothetical protein